MNYSTLLQVLVLGAREMDNDQMVDSLNICDIFFQRMIQSATKRNRI